MTNIFVCVSFISMTSDCYAWDFNFSSKPSLEVSRQRVQNLINRNAKGYIKLVGFRKKNGIEHELSGYKAYTMLWVADLEFREDCIWNETSFSAAPMSKGKWSKPQVVNGVYFEAFSVTDWIYSEFETKWAKKGATASVSESYVYIKTDNGWELRH